MAQRLCNREVGIVQLHIFADKSYLYSFLSIPYPLNHINPLGKCRSWGLDVQLAAYNLRQMLALKVERSLVEDGHGQVLDDAVRLDIAEVCDLPEYAFFGDRLVTAEHYDVGGDSCSLKFLYRVLGRL